MTTANLSHRITALQAARILLTAESGSGSAMWVGDYWFPDARAAYRAVARSIRMARSSRLHCGDGPFGRGPSAFTAKHR